jgi:hypothetical protein
MEHVLLWIQVLQALATPAIAALATVIGLGQWRTARQRVVLDLFDKRWTVLIDLRSIIGEVMREGRVTTGASLEFARAIDRASFLFGPEVIQYLWSIHRALGRHYVAGSTLAADQDNGPRREKLIDQEYNAMNEISEFFTHVERLVSPYMRMHQRSPRI